MKTDEELKNIVNQILLLKGKDKEFCPSCGNETKYFPNPFYFHECETCGESTYMGSLIYKSDIDYMVEILKKNFSDLKETL